MASAAPSQFQHVWAPENDRNSDNYTDTAVSSEPGSPWSLAWTSFRPQRSSPVYEHVSASSGELPAGFVPPLASHKAMSRTFQTPVRQLEKIEENPDALQLRVIPLMILALCVATFLAGLNQSIIVPALPTIAARFRSLDDIGLYQAVFLLPQCVLQPAFSKLYSVTPFSWAFIASVLILAVGSIVSATANNSAVMILGRMFSGIGTEGLAAGTFGTYAQLSTPYEQNIFMGLMLLVLGSGIILGPIIGGPLTSGGEMRWIFWINLPFLGLILAIFLLNKRLGGPDLKVPDRERSPDKQGLGLDWLVTTGLLILSLIPFILALYFSQKDSWRSARVNALLVVAGLATVGFVVHQILAGEKLFDQQIMSRRSVWAAFGVSVAGLSTLSVLALFIPFLLQVIKDESSQQVGFEMVPLYASLSLGAFACFLAPRALPYSNPVAILGALCLLVGACIFVALDWGVSIAEVVGYEIVAGCGVGIVWMAGVMGPWVLLEAPQFGAALESIRLAQQIGMSLALQIATVIFVSSFRQQLQALDLPATLLSGLLQGVALAPGGAAVPPSDLDVAVTQAYSTAIRRALVLANVCAAGALVFTAFLPWRRLVTPEEREDGRRTRYRSVRV